MATIDPQLRIRSARLAVADLDRSSGFYERVLGLPLIERDDGRALLGTDRDAPALELEQLDGARPAPPRSTGLFHIAWLHPSRAGLAETVRRVAAAGWPFSGASDHAVSEALYLNDPDGLGIEIYVDRPRELWTRGADGGYVIVTEPLDVEDLLAQSTDSPGPQAEPGTAIGHVHLKVSDVPRALAFYDALGFERQALLPSAAFISAGGYHHHIGLNSWQSAGGAPAPADAPGLREVDFELPGGEQVRELAERAGGTADGAAIELLDPDGERLVFRTAAAQAA